MNGDSVSSRTLVFGTLVLFIVLFFACPLAYWLTLPSLSDHLHTLKSPLTVAGLSNTLYLSTLVSLVTTSIGFPFAWLISRTDLPLKKWLRSALALPYTIPAYIGAIGWILLANPSSGLLKNLGLPIGSLYSFFGLVFVETLFLYPFVFLSCLKSLDNADPSLEEAARMSGASPFRVLADITWPLIRPSLISGGILSFLATASSFGVPALIAGPARIPVLTTQIFQFQRLGTESGLKMGLSLATWLATLSLILTFVSESFARSNLTPSIAGKISRPNQIEMGLWKWPLSILLNLFFILSFFLPLCALIIAALSQVQGQWSLDNITFQHVYQVLILTEESTRAITQSFILAATTAIGSVLFSFFWSYFSNRNSNSNFKWVETAIHQTFGLPGSVLALVVIIVFRNGYFGVGPQLYNSLTLIFIAYFLKYTSLSLRIIKDGYSLIHPCLEEAAQLSGAGFGRILLTIYFPLLKPQLTTAFFLVFIPCLSELTMTLLLTGPGLETIGVMIYQFQEYSDISGAGSAIFSLLVVFIVIASQILIKKISRGRYGI